MIFFSDSVSGRCEDQGRVGDMVTSPRSRKSIGWRMLGDHDVGVQATLQATPINKNPGRGGGDVHRTVPHASTSHRMGIGTSVHTHIYTDIRNNCQTSAGNMQMISGYPVAHFRRYRFRLIVLNRIRISNNLNFLGISNLGTWDVLPKSVLCSLFSVLCSLFSILYSRSLFPHRKGF